MSKRIGKFLIAILCLISSNVIAQDMESNAITFGTNNNDGTARYIAVGGAMSAIGADITNISYNPAGIGVYNSSVFVFTPTLEANKTNTVFNTSSRQRTKSKLYFSNVGMVFHMPNSKHSVIKNVNLGLAVTSTNRFTSNNVFKLDTKNSITKNWVNESFEVNGNKEEEFTYDKFSFETVGAWYTALVNYDSTNHYTSPIHNSIIQKRYNTISGGKKDYSVALGANVFNKLYVGASLSLPSIEYTSNTTITEKDESDVNGNFEKFELTQTYKNEGYGVNAKIGAIYKPISLLRVSASIQTKTRYTMNEEYTSDFVTSFDTAVYELESPKGEFEYDLTTPWKANAGIAMVHKKYGFVSIDYEMVDYASTKFYLDEEYSSLQNEMNRKIKNKYQMAHNLKAGIEFKIKKYRLRGGYNFQTSPLKENFREGSNDFSRQQFSAGVGYLWKKISLDAAYRYTLSKEYELSYDNTNGIYKDNYNQLFSVTLGFKLSK